MSAFAKTDYGTYTVLIIDDDPLVLKMIARQMSTRGFRTAISEDGENGFRQAKSVRPDLILLDVSMPRIDGFETCRRLKQDEDTRDIPVIFLTGMTSPEDIIRGFEVGGVDYVTKPSWREELFARVETHLEIRHLQTQLEKANRRLEQRVSERTADLEALNKNLRTEIGERRRAEEALERHREHLRELVRERTAELRDEIRAHKQDKERLRWELKVNSALAELSTALITPGLGITEITDVVLKHARNLTNSDHGYVSSIDPDTKDNVDHTLTGMMGKSCIVESKDKKIAFPVGPDGRYPGLWGHALNTREAFYTNSPDTHEMSRGIPPGHIPLGNFLSVPVLLGEELVGQIALANAENGYTDENLEAVTRLAALYAMDLQRCRYEDALRKSETRYRTLVEATPYGIVETDISGIRTFVNRSYLRITGYDKEEVTGKPVWSLLTPDSERERVKNYFPKLVREQPHGYSLTGKMKKKEGSIIDAQIDLGYKRDEQDQVTGVISVITDITEKEQRKAAFELEMSRAKEIYDRILEPRLPVMTDMAISVKCMPAELVGGDVFEVLKRGENRLLIFLADVTGHGIPAAMTANVLKMLFNEIAETTADPAAICEYLNRKVSRITSPDDAVSVFCGEIDPEAMTLTYYHSGLPSPLILRDHELIRLKPTGLPICFMDDLIAGCKCVPIRKNDMLIAFTDGITEAISQDGRLFGYRGAEELIGKIMPNVHDAVEHLVKKATLFQQKDTFQDDVILFAVRLSDEEEKTSATGWSRFCGPDKFLFKIKTKSVNIDETVSLFINHVAEKAEVPYERLKRLKIAFSEILTNAVEHGNLEMSALKNVPVFLDSERYRQVFRERSQSDRYGEKLIRMECLHRGDYLEISVEDDGPGFDPQAVPDPKENTLRMSGRGIHLAKMNADRVVYNSKGNRATLLYRL
ncbi:SpoIIE family protein phosphatase [Desulfobacterales bacterium HSG2]|nr:SpoIIE family protein phosphatase [Desulfobacterales bacterium HSG2]